tara:strand:+ start:370 stop:1329 length:960 start_codon:yes stop_codon:yes gene_type:complete
MVKILMEELFKCPSLIEEIRVARENRQPWIGKGAIKDISGFFSYGQFEALLNQTGIWAPGRLQVVLDNKPIPQSDLFPPQQNTTGGGNALNTQVLENALKRGSSIILNDISGLSPGVMQIREFLANWTMGKLDCNLYYSQKDHQAFPVHFDVHDVFAIQVEGKKHWQVFDEYAEYPINHPHFTNARYMNPQNVQGSPILDFVFEEGDLLYIPSGFPHHASCREGRSLHLSFGLVEMLGMDVISQAFEYGIKEKFFRTPLNKILREKDPIDFYLRKWAKQVKDLATDPDFKKRLEANLENFRYRADHIDLGSDKKNNTKN